MIIYNLEKISTINIFMVSNNRMLGHEPIVELALFSNNKQLSLQNVVIGFTGPFLFLI
jgi:hypothetical protein